MTNTLGYYNPVFYATEALIYLKKALGMALSVNRSYEVERGSFNQGEYVNIKSPSTMTVNDAPATAQSLTTGSTQIQLAYWREVKFKLTDKELAFTGERIIQDHILPAAYELAADVDTKLAAQYKNIPWVYALDSTPGSVVKDITGPKRILFDNKVPMIEQNLFYMIDGELQMGFQGLANFTQWQGSGPQGVAAQMSGIIGPRYGVNVFANQNVQAHTKGTHAVSSGTFELVGAHSAGATTIAADATGVTGTLVAGDTFVIEGGTQRYTVTATATASGNAYASISIFPALVQNYSDNADITVTLNTTTAENLMYHRDAFALVMAPLPAQMVREAMGAKVETITDPDTGISIRARTYYMPDVSEVNVALDVLYGVKTLNPNLAVRAYAT
jgi:hypothetical protein